MKKRLVWILMMICIIAPLLIASCGGESSAFVVINRESGSGTRDTFEEKVMTWTNDAGLRNSKQISIRSEQYDSTQGVINAVATINDGIGYVSAGFLSNTTSVKAVTIDGIACTKETVLNGSYPLARVLYFITKGEANDAEKAFIYWVQNDGQNFVEDEHYFRFPDGYKFVETKVAANPGYQMGSDPVLDMTGGWTPNTLSEGGSTTVFPLADRWSKEYKKVTGRNVIVAGGGSGTGVQSTIEGLVDIGAISRDLFSNERVGGDLIPYDIAIDGVAIIVSSHLYDDLGITNLTLEQVRNIFAGGTGTPFPTK